MGITIEAENAQEQSAARAAVSKKKKDPGYSIEISSIHRRVKEMMRSRATTPETEAVASKGPVYQSLQDAESDLPPGWEARLDESSGESCGIAEKYGVAHWSQRDDHYRHNFWIACW